MRISTECRDPDLLAAEVRRLQAVIDAGEPCPYVTGTVTRYCTLTPFTLTDAEREAVDWSADFIVRHLGGSGRAALLRGLLERTKEVASE